MTEQIKNTEAYGKLEPFQKNLIIRRENRKQLEDAIITARHIGYYVWEASSPMPAAWKAIVKELTDDLMQKCESCEQMFKYDDMESDADFNWFCPPCWIELAPIMEAEYRELLAKGEIEEID